MRQKGNPRTNIIRWRDPLSFHFHIINLLGILSLPSKFLFRFKASPFFSSSDANEICLEHSPYIHSVNDTLTPLSVTESRNKKTKLSKSNERKTLSQHQRTTCPITTTFNPSFKMHHASKAIAVFGLASLGRSHMIMNTPVPMGLATLNNSPLAADGSDFPCKLRTGAYAVTTVNTMALGSTQPLKFTGSATHGGGSCQISITYDAAPSADSVFKVIHSIVGGCPIEGVAGNNGDSASAVDPSTYSFTIPTNLPTGNATLAWTWFNKIGNREMYMNCAAIDITSSSTKRQELVERDQAAFNALPDMFKANIGNGCTSADSKDLIFPDPGESVESLGGSTASTAAATPSGTGCGAVVSATGGSVVASTTAAGASKASTTAVASVTSAPAVSGGVFITVGTTTAAGATTAPVATSSAKASVATTLATSVAASPVVSSASPASTGTSASGTAITAGTACTTEGEWNCIGGTSFQQCASGTWSAVQSVAAGTTCSGGESTNLSIAAIAQKRGGMVDSIIDATKRRAIRFSGQHLHRHRMSN